MGTNQSTVSSSSDEYHHYHQQEVVATSKSADLLGHHHHRNDNSNNENAFTTTTTMMVTSSGGGGGSSGVVERAFRGHHGDDASSSAAAVEGRDGSSVIEGVVVSSQEFDNTVRENIIFLLFFLTLIGISSLVIDVLSPRSNSISSSGGGGDGGGSTASNGKHQNHHASSTPPKSSSLVTPAKRTSSSSSPSSASAATSKKQQRSESDEESVVKRICTWLCTLTLSISIGATLLLPISIISNEVLLLYPTNAYLEWLNGMLIQGLWNLVFLFANICLFLLLPFAHLFIESEGFSGKRGLMSKMQETAVILILIMFMVWGIAALANSFFLQQPASSPTATLHFHFNQLPFIYSFISFSGVLVFTVCTPLGLSRLFTVLSDNFLLPEFLRNLENEHVSAVLECENLKNQRDRAVASAEASNTSHHDNGGGSSSSSGGGIFSRRHNAPEVTTTSLNEDIEKMEAIITRLESQRTTPPWKRNLLYPSLFLCVFSVTGLTVFIVLINAFKIVAGFRDLSMELVAKETLPLGRSSLGSFLGPCGAIFEIILVMYLITTCLIGLYNAPWFRNITPKLHRTPASNLIWNCGIVLVLSSALPVFMRILGLTNFDLLGTYAGKIDWIENTLIVVSVNLLFTFAVAATLLHRVSRRIRDDIIRRFKLVLHKD